MDLACRWRKWWYSFTYPFWALMVYLNSKRIIPTWLHIRILKRYTLSRSLWHPAEYPDDYWWKHFGEPLHEIPAEVILGAIRHQVQIHEGVIVFSQRDGMYGTHSRISFEKDSDGSLWYLRFSETWGKVPVAHVLKAYKYVEAVYGGDFAGIEKKKKLAAAGCKQNIMEPES